MADRFFTEQPLGHGVVTLDGAEAHHLAAVRRFVPGDRVVLFNGDGHDYLAEVLSSEKKSCTLNIVEQVTVNRELPFRLVVASAIPKGDRADFLIEKLTELGVTEFIPLITTRSVVIPKETTIEKFRRAVIEASKQCGRNRLMTISPVETWAKYLTRSGTARFVLHTSAERLSMRIPTGDVAYAIGPEGGFTSDEIDAATAAGHIVVQFGSRTLRVETAAITAAISAILPREHDIAAVDL